MVFLNLQWSSYQWGKFCSIVPKDPLKVTPEKFVGSMLLGFVVSKLADLSWLIYAAATEARPTPDNEGNTWRHCLMWRITTDAVRNLPDCNSPTDVWQGGHLAHVGPRASHSKRERAHAICASCHRVWGHLPLGVGLLGAGRHGLLYLARRTRLSGKSSQGSCGGQPAGGGR